MNNTYKGSPVTAPVLDEMTDMLVSLRMAYIALSLTEQEKDHVTSPEVIKLALDSVKNSIAKVDSILVGKLMERK